MGLPLAVPLFPSQKMVPVVPVRFHGPELVLEQALLGATLAHAQGKVNHSILTVSQLS